MALTMLCQAAGPQTSEALILLSKLFDNIAKHPDETKFRKINPGNARLQKGLFCYKGASEFFEASGFVKAADGTVELPSTGDASTAFVKGHAALVRKCQAHREQKMREEQASGAASMTAGYRAAVEGGAKGSGAKELQSVKALAGGKEALALAERVLMNLQRFPDNKQYRCVNLAKAAGKQLLPALPVLQLVGFEKGKLPSGEECLQVERLDSEAIARVWAMVWWANQPLQELKTSAPGVSASALGAVLGAAVGDALGAPLGGKKPFDVTAAEIDKAMEMCGGGSWPVAPGQVTSNTELMICHAAGLVAGRELKVKGFPVDEVAEKYAHWHMTLPFHVEFACGRAFSRLMSGYEMQTCAAASNQNCFGNGALVRSLPSAVLGAARGKPEAAAAGAFADAQLSHSEPVICHASAAYVVAAAHLIASEGDRSSALKKVKEWTASESEKAGDAGDFQELARWLSEALDGDNDVLPFATERGDPVSAKVAIAHAFRHLKLGSTFEDAMRATLAGGGDCHTNAAAVGGIVGAAVGLGGIPERWVRAVLTSSTVMGQDRPLAYHPDKLVELLEKVCAAK
eukprot:TRINITY_DN41113_c0_g1_i1.p1 TRINITY_DN41113_c0_g1~~TRINITY_DN41113_c0_g1_i1.p1  ORF type:complete len:573 (-),score=125.61 TRINITY_DN41113_c0_g1_i1:92-1810(-)